MQTNPYLFFNGQCEAAFKFYEEHLGGKIVAMMTHAETPCAAESWPEWQNAIMHARMTLGDTVLMGGDAPPQYYKTPQGFAVSLLVGSAEEADRVFTALAENGTVQMPLEETFWAVRFGMLTDRFGTPWMINCEKAA